MSIKNNIINQENTGIIKYINFTKALREEMKVAADECVKGNPEYNIFLKNKKGEPKTKKEYAIGKDQAYKCLTQDIGIVSNLPGNTDRLCTGSFYKLMCGTTSASVIAAPNLNRIRNFFSINRNLSQETRDKLPILFPKDGEQKLEVTLVGIMPQLHKEICDIVRLCQKDEKISEILISKYSSDNKHSKHRNDTQCSVGHISQEMGFYEGKIVTIYTGDRIRALEKIDIEKIKAFVSKYFPGEEYQFPGLFDTNLFKADKFSIINSEAPYHTSHSEDTISNFEEDRRALLTNSASSKSKKRPADETQSKQQKYRGVIHIPYWVVKEFFDQMQQQPSVEQPKKQNIVDNELENDDLPSGAPSPLVDITKVKVESQEPIASQVQVEPQGLTASQVQVEPQELTASQVQVEPQELTASQVQVEPQELTAPILVWDWEGFSIMDEVNQFPMEMSPEATQTDDDPEGANLPYTDTDIVDIADSQELASLGNWWE